MGTHWQLLAALRVAGAEWTRPSDPRTTARQAQALRRLGLALETGEKGVRLVGPEPPLFAAELTEGLGTRRLGKKAICLDSVDSTNERAWKEAAAGAREGAVIVAEEQESGRGRLGRSWFSPRGGGLWMSILLRPDFPLERAPLLTSVAALAGATAIQEETGLLVRITWPNDLTVGGRKLGGVLVEARDPAPKRTTFVLGLGLNVNMAPSVLPRELRRFATSLSHETGRAVDRVSLARRLLCALDREYVAACEGDIAGIAERWKGFLALVGKRVRVKEAGRWNAGRLVDIDPCEGILLYLDAGAPRRFRLEHVEMLRPMDP